MTAAPQLLARGTLEKDPLALLLARLYDAQAAGTLILQTAAGAKCAVLFDRGAPAKARVAESGVFLSDVLVDLGMVERSLVVSTRKKAQAEGLVHGQVLLREGKLDQTELYVALREQLKRQTLKLCDLPGSTEYGFYKANYLAKWGDASTWRAKPLPLMWRALADHTPKNYREALLARWGEHPIRIRAVAPLGRYDMSQTEEAVVNMIRAQSMPISELENSGVGSPEAVRKVVFAMLSARLLEREGLEKEPLGYREPAESPGSVVPPPESETSSPRSQFTPPRSARSPTLPRSATAPGSGIQPRTATTGQGPTGRAQPAAPDSAMERELRAQMESYFKQEPVTHYDVLGVSRDATTAQVRAAFFQLARIWHPDRLPAALADLRSKVAVAFSKMTEAHQVLSDTKKKADYDEILNDVGDDEQEQVALILNAAAAFQRAQVLVKKKNYNEALKEVETAYEGDPTQADYRALYGYLLSLQPNAVMARSLELLNEAVKVEPENVNARWYRGQVLKKAGQQMKAQADFKKIVELKPNHIDAAREIRVFKMRRRSDGATKTGGGLFNRGKK